MSEAVVAKPRRRDMREYARRQADLCVTYAEDGAYHSAARVARKLADDLQAHADRVSPRTEAGAA
jgi:hypothetical protein